MKDWRKNGGDGADLSAEVRFMCGGVTLAELERNKVRYHQVASSSMKGKTVLQPTTWFRHLTTFIERRLYPLEMHITQSMRLAIMSGEYMLGEKFANAGSFPTFSCVVSFCSHPLSETSVLSTCADVY